jgi:hypothetical protein
MKKLLVLGLTIAVIFAVFAAFSLTLAQEGATAIKTVDIKAAPAKGCCPGGGTKTCAPGAKTAGACTPEQMAACSAKLGLTAEECANFCKSDKYQVVRMTVTGMTDAAAEEAVRLTLKATPGVEKIGLVSAADNLAVVVFNSPEPSVCKGAIQALELKGYKVDVAPLEVTTQPDVKTVTAPQKGCAATCGAAAAAACGAKKQTCASGKTTETKTLETKTTDK